VSSPPMVASESGMTLIELAVSMTVMSLAVTIFTSGFVLVYGMTNRTDAAATAQLQLDIAYRRLDRELRYASAISKPAVLGGDAYVEYTAVQLAWPNATPPDATTISVCVELRFSASGRQLQRRSWDPTVQPIAPTAWVPLADGVQPGSAAASTTQPFTLLPADPVYNFERLRVSLVGTAGRGSSAQSRDASVTYNALNSDPAKTTDTVCTAGRSVP